MNEQSTRQNGRNSARGEGVGGQLIGLGVLAVTVATVGILSSKSATPPFFRKHLEPKETAAAAAKQPSGPRHWFEQKYPGAEPLLKNIASKLNFDWNRPEVRGVICGEVVDMRQKPGIRATEGFELQVSEAAVFVEIIETINRFRKEQEATLPEFTSIDFQILWWRAIGVPLKTGNYKPEEGKWLAHEANVVFEEWVRQNGLDLSGGMMPPAVHH